MMDKQSAATLRQKWRGFVEFLQRPKTRFDLKDRGRGILLFILLCWLLMRLVEAVVR